jgi:Zn-dependent protease with chaperone function
VGNGDLELEAAGQFVRWSPYAWGGLVSLLVLFYAMARLATWLATAAARWPLRRYHEAAWTERARFAWPSRRLGPAASGFFAGLSVTAFLGSSPDNSPLPRFVLVTLAMTAGLLGIIQSMIANERRVNPAFALTPMATRGAWVFRLSIWGPIFLVALVVAGFLPDHLNLTAVIELTLIALGMGVYLGWGWSAIMRWLGVFRPASERLCAIAAGLSEQSGVTVRRVEQVSLPMANAFALPLDGSLAMTDAAMAALNDDEVRAICAHELAHLAEPRVSVWIRVLRGFTIGLFLALIAAASRPLLYDFGLEGALSGLAAAFLLLIVSTSLLNRYNQKLEHRADAHAVGWENSPGLYARALEKIHEVNLIPAVLRSKRMTHPHLYDRMVQSGVTPDYPRPAPPPRWPGLVGLATLIAATVLGVMAYELVTDFLPRTLFDPASAAIWKMGAGRL